MMKNKLIVSSFRKLKTSKKRFLSLMCLALLGVGFFAGIKATSPDMLKTIDEYLKKQNVFDIELISNLGLSYQDVDEIKKLSSVKDAVGVNAVDELVNMNGNETVIRIMSLTEINQVILKEGQLPKENNEIVVEKKFLEDSDYELGSVIKLNGKNFSSNEFKIVGVVESPLYFTMHRGVSTVGSGEWKYYCYTTKDAFQKNYYTNIYITLKETKNELTNSEQYLERVEKGLNELKVVEPSRTDNRFNELYGTKINEMQKMGLKVDLSSFLRPTWQYQTRIDNGGYSTFIDATKSIDKIGTVFPLVFYVVAILISLISMSRMVEEERNEMGALKGLGFSSLQLLFKNIFYAFIPTFIGGILGSIIGFQIIPRVIWSIYTNLFVIPEFICEFQIFYAFIGLFIACLCIGGATIYTTVKLLREKPSNLMRVKAPKIGKKIFLEKFSIWKKLKFSTKISIRNVFRYKKRVLITIIGIAGSTALMLVGFGLKDSVTDIVDFNYNRIFVYNRILYLKKDSSSSLEELLKSNKEITSLVKANFSTVDLYNKERKNYHINLIIPENKEELKNVIHLNNIHKNNEEITLPENEIVLSEKLAKNLKVKEKDKVSFKVNEQFIEVEVGAIIENYIQDYAYLSKDTASKIFGEKPSNVYFIKNTLDYENDFDKEIMKQENVASIITKESATNLVSQILDSLNSVVMVLIVSSAILSFVILYNLSAVNISERKREISTLKVLGFYDEEVDHYITNETYFITLIGIFIGLYFGLYLCHYIIHTCEPEFVMFIRHIKFQSYLISAFISFIFTLIVNKITHFNLKKIDMVESLKNNE